MSAKRKSYTKTEKLEIVKLSLDKANHPIKELAERFDVDRSTIYNWRRIYLKHKEDSFPGNGNKIQSESDRKIRQLEKELKEARLETEILKKAVGIFSKTSRKFSNL